MTAQQPPVIDARTPGRTHYKRMTETENLGQWDLQRDDGTEVRPVVVIESVRQYVPPKRRKKRMADGSFQFERNNKLLIRFVDKRKAWIAGPTVQKSIESLYGPILQDWIGKKLTLYVDKTVTMGSKTTGGIRVLNRAPTEEPTDDPLDRQVDAELSALLGEVFDATEDGKQGEK